MTKIIYLQIKSTRVFLKKIGKVYKTYFLQRIKTYLLLHAL